MYSQYTKSVTMAFAGKLGQGSPVSTFLESNSEKQLTTDVHDEDAIRQGSDLFANWKDKREGLRLFREHKRRKNRSAAGGVRSSASTGDFANDNDTPRTSTAQPHISSFYTPNVRRRGGGARGVSSSAGLVGLQNKYVSAGTQPVILGGQNDQPKVSASPEPSLLPNAGNFTGILSNENAKPIELTFYAVEPRSASRRRENNDAEENVLPKTLDDADDAGEIVFTPENQHLPLAVSFLPSDFTTPTDSGENVRAISDYSSSNSISTVSWKVQQRPADTNGVVSTTTTTTYAVLPSQLPAEAVSPPSSTESLISFTTAPPPPTLPEQQVLRSEIDAQRNTFFASLLSPQNPPPSELINFVVQPSNVVAVAANVHAALQLSEPNSKMHGEAASLLSLPPVLSHKTASDMQSADAQHRLPVSYFDSEYTVAAMPQRMVAEPVIYPPVIPSANSRPSETAGYTSPLRRLSYSSPYRMSPAIVDNERRRRSSAADAALLQSNNNAERNDAEYFEEDNRLPSSSTASSSTHQRRLSSIGSRGDSSMQVSKSLSLDAFESLRSEIDGLRSKISQKEHALLDEKRAAAAIIETHRREIALLKDDIFRSAKQLEATQSTEREELQRKQQEQQNAEFIFTAPSEDRVDVSVVISRLEQEKLGLQTQLNDARRQMSENQTTFQTCIDGLNAEVSRLQNEIVFSHQQQQRNAAKSDTETETEDDTPTSSRNSRRLDEPTNAVVESKTPLPSALLWHDDAIEIAEAENELNALPILTPVNSTRFTQLDFEMLKKENEELRAALAENMSQSVPIAADLSAEVEKLQEQLRQVEDERAQLQQQLIELQQAELLHEMQDAEQNERIAQLEEELEVNRAKYDQDSVEKLRLAEEGHQRALQDVHAVHQTKIQELTQRTAEQHERMMSLQRELNEKLLNDDARKSIAAQWQPSEWYEQSEQVLDAVALAHARRDAATSKKALENARSRIILLEGDKEDLRKQLESIRSECDAKIAELVVSHASAEAAMEAEISRLTEIAESTVQENVTAETSSAAVDENADEIVELKQILADSEKQINELQTQLALADDEKQSMIAATQQKLGQLADEIDRLTNELAEKSTAILEDFQNSSGSSGAEAVGDVTQEFELEELRALLKETRNERDLHSRQLSSLETQLSQARLAVRHHETQLASMTEHYEHRMHELHQQLLRANHVEEQQLAASSSESAASERHFGDWDISDDEMTLPSVAPAHAAAADAAEQQRVLMSQLRQDYEKQIAELQQQLAALARQYEVQKLNSRQRTTSSTSSASTSPSTTTIRPASSPAHVGVMAVPDVAHADSQTNLEAAVALQSPPPQITLPISTETVVHVSTDAAELALSAAPAANESAPNSRPSSASVARQQSTPPHIASIIHTNAALELRERLEDKTQQLTTAEQKLATLSDSYQASLAALNNEIKRLQKVLIDNDAERQRADAQAAQVLADNEQVISDLRRRADEQRELVQQCEQLVADKNASIAITTHALDEQILALKVQAEQLHREKDDVLQVVTQYEAEIDELNRALQSVQMDNDTEMQKIRDEVALRVETESGNRLEAARNELTEHFTTRIGQLETSLRRADSHYQQTIQQLESRLAFEQNAAEERLREAIGIKTQRIQQLETIFRTAETNYSAEVGQLRNQLAAQQQQLEAVQKPVMLDAEVQAEFESLMENNLREELESMRTAFTEQLGELEATLNAKTAAFDEVELEKHRVVDQLNAAQAEMHRLKSLQNVTKDEQNAEIIVLKQQVQNVRAEITASMQANIDAERQKLQVSNETLRAAESEVKMLNEKLVELQERCQTLSAELADAGAALKSRAALCQQLTSELDGTTSELAAIKTQNDSLLQNEKLQVDSRLKHLQSEYESNRTELQAQLQRARADLARQTQLYNELKHQKAYEVPVAAAEPGESVALFAVDDNETASTIDSTALAAAEAAASDARAELQTLQRQLDDTRHEARRERERLRQQLERTQQQLADVSKLYSAEREIVARLERDLQQMSVPTPTATAASSDKVATDKSGSGWEHGGFDDENDSSSSSASLSSEFAQQLADVRQQLVEANRLLQEQKQQAAAVSTKTDDFDETREKLAAALSAQEQNYARLQQQLQEAEHQIDAHKTMLSNFEERVHELEETNSQLQAEKAELDTIREQLLRAQAECEKEIHTLNQLLNDAGQALSEKHEQQQQVDDRMRQLENELKDAKSLVLTNTREFEQQLDTVVQAEQRAVIEARSRLDEATRAHRAEVEALTLRIQNERDRAETLQRDLSAAQQTSMRAAAEMHADKTVAERKIAALESKVADLLVREAELAAMVGETDAVKRQLSTANARVRELERDQVRTQKQHDELTLHNAHLSELRAMQMTSENELRTTAQKLQAERDEARAATVIVQNNANSAQAEIERLQRAHAELERQIRDNKQAVELLQLQQRSPVSLGSSSAAIPNVVQDEQKLKKSPESGQIGPFTREKQEEYEQKISQLEHSRNDAAEQLRFANSARQQAEQRLRDARQQQQRVEAEVVQLQAQLDQVKTNKIEVLYTNKALENAHAELDAVRKELQEARTSLQTEYDRSRRQQAATVAELQQRNAELSETQRQLLAAKKDCSSLEQRLQDMRSIHAQLQQECNKAQIELGRNDQALSALRDNELAARNRTQVSVAEYTALGEQLVELRAALTRRNDELRAQEQNVTVLTQQVESLRQQQLAGKGVSAHECMPPKTSPAVAAAVQTDDETQWSPAKRGISSSFGDAVDRNRAESGSTPNDNASSVSAGAATPANASSIADMSSILSPLRQMAVDSQELFALCQSPHFQQLMTLIADGVLTVADLHELSTTIAEKRNGLGGGGDTFAIPRASSSASTPTRQRNVSTSAAAVDASRFTTTTSTGTTSNRTYTVNNNATSRRQLAPEELHQLDQHFRQVVNALYNTLKAHKLLEKFADYLRDLEMCQRHYSDALIHHKRHAEELEHDTQLIEEKLSKQILILEEKQAVQKRLIEQQNSDTAKQTNRGVSTTTTINKEATEMREQLKLCSLLERTLEEARAEQRTTLSTLGERERQLAALQRADKLRARQMVQIQQQLDTAQKTAAQRDIVYEQMEREVESLRRRVHVLQASLQHTEHLFSNMLMKVTNSTDEFFILPSSSTTRVEEISSTSATANNASSNNTNALTLFSSTADSQAQTFADENAEVSITSYRFAEASAQRYRGEYMRSERFRRMLTLQKLYLIRLFSSVERMCCDAATRASANAPPRFDDTADRLLLFILRALRPSAATLYPAPDSPFYSLMQRSKTLRQYAVRSPLKRFKGCVMLVRAVYRMQREARFWKSLQLKTQRMKNDAEAMRDLKLQRISVDEQEDRGRHHRHGESSARRRHMSTSSLERTTAKFSHPESSDAVHSKPPDIASSSSSGSTLSVPSASVPFLRSRSDNNNSKPKPLTLSGVTEPTLEHASAFASSTKTAAAVTKPIISSRDDFSKRY